MILPQRLSHNIFSSLLLLTITINNYASSQTSRQSKPRTLEPLGDVLHLVLDKDKNQKVTMDEVNSQMTMLDQLFQGMETGEEAETYQKIIKGVKAVAPTVFLLLDINGDEALSKRELSHVTNFESSLKKKEGGMRQLLRDVFDLLDSNGDDQLSVKELMDGCASEDVLAKVAAKFHELFPLRSTSKELESFVKSTIESIGGGVMTLDEESVLKGMKWLDEDGDGYISRKEVGKYYNSAGKKFIEMSKTVRQMGPMLAMMGGMNFQGDGGGNGKTAFHMMGDL